MSNQTGSILNMLTTSSIFKTLAGEEGLGETMKEVKVLAGDVIFHFGDVGDCLYLVRTGQVELSVRSKTGEKIILKVTEAGELFGELSLLDNGPRTATAIALEDTSLLVLEQENFHGFLQKNPEAAIELLEVLGSRIRQTNNLLRHLSSLNPNTAIEQKLSFSQRIANHIANFSGSMPFLYINASIFIVWVFMNVGWVPGLQAFDPYPFGFLTMAVSLEAIFLSIFVLLAQNLQATKDRIRSDVEYEVNLRAELEVAELHEKIDQMNADVLNKLHQLEKTVRKS